MQLGTHLRELWTMRGGVAASVVLALLAAVWSVASISLLPPGLSLRELEMATASTRVLVDAPRSSVLDLSVDTYDFEAIKNRALLVGNVMASDPVRSYIGRRAGIDPALLLVSGPITVAFPRRIAATDKPSAGDILDAPDQHRLSIHVNPTVPVLDIYAQAPSADTARLLADGAVEGMRDYLRDMASDESIPAERQVALKQLGRAEGGVVNEGAGVELAVLSFLLVLVASCGVVLFSARVRRGWQRSGARAAQA